MEASADKRRLALAAWLKSECGLQFVSLQAMPGDASFRRYFRLHTSTGSLVAMDAPPAQENCRPYIAIANALRSRGLQTPEIIAAELEQGFLLITDFGGCDLSQDTDDTKCRLTLSMCVGCIGSITELPCGI